MTATEPSHVPSQGSQRIFPGETRSSEGGRQRFLRSFVIVSFRAFPLRDGTLPEVNVLLNQSAAAGNKIPLPPRLPLGPCPGPPSPDGPPGSLLRLCPSGFCALRPLRGRGLRRLHDLEERPREKLARKGERALPARGGMCNAPGAEVPLPAGRFLFLFVCRG